MAKELLFKHTAKADDGQFAEPVLPIPSGREGTEGLAGLFFPVAGEACIRRERREPDTGWRSQE